MTEKKNLSELQTQQEYLEQVKAAIASSLHLTYTEGFHDGFNYAIKNNCSGQIQHGGSSEPLRSVHGESSQSQSTVPTDSEGAEA